MCIDWDSCCFFTDAAPPRREPLPTQRAESLETRPVPAFLASEALEIVVVAPASDAQIQAAAAAPIDEIREAVGSAEGDHDSDQSIASDDI